MTAPPSLLASRPDNTAGGRNTVIRIITADLDAVSFFENLTPGADIDALLKILSLTSPTLLNAIGNPRAVPTEARVYGKGSGWIMPAFTRIVRPSRFTDGRFGIWYAGWSLETAIAETIYHNTNRLKETSEPAQKVALQVLTADIAGFGALLWGVPEPFYSAIHDPASYAVSQVVGRHLQERGSDAVVYRSVRHRGGICTGGLRASAVGNCRRVGFITYAWDGITLTAGPLRPA